MADAANHIATSNTEQAKLWGGSAGQAWADSQDLTDEVFRPIEHMLLDSIPPAFTGNILDVGCGTGSTTQALANKIGAHGQCTGVDISAPMIAAAQQRASQAKHAAHFLLADAQHYAFAPAQFDLIVSRFGVMFFSDFTEAFANLRRATRPSGGLRFVAWRSTDDNPFMTTAERAAATLLPNIPPRQAGGPGQFAFADDALVQSTLEASGWRDIEILPVDFVCTFPESKLLQYVTRFGPVGRVFAEANEQTQGRVVDALLSAFAPFVVGDQVQFSAACWVVGAKAMQG